VVARRDANLEIARRAGADETINSSISNPVEALTSIFGPEGLDFAFDCVGGKSETLTECVKAVRPNGAVGFLGLHSPDYEVDAWLVMTKEVTIYPVWSYCMFGEEHEFNTALSLLAAGRLDAESIITHRFALDRFLQALEVAQDKKTSNAVKVLIKP
jgi:threonine dehydrogenase-like Zn-dependent dehydrogenase